MKKKKIKIFMTVFAAVFVLYIISAVFLFLSEYRIECASFAENNTIAYNAVQSLAEAGDPRSDVMKCDFLSCAYMNPYPVVYSLTDSNGNLLASNRPAFVLDYTDETGNYIDTYILDTYTYTTDETTERIIDFVENCEHGCQLRAEWISVCKNGEEYIPVGAVLYNGFNDDDGKITVKFTDLEPTFTVYEEKNGIITAHGYFTTQNAKMHEYTDRLNFEQDVFLNRFTETHEYVDYHSGGGISSNDSFQREQHFINNGVSLCLYYSSRYDLEYAAFTSDNYRYMLTELSICFFFVALIIAFVLIRVERKNEKLAQSRRAFVAAAAHELKTPLAVIANKSECILENVSPEQTAEYVNSIYDESKRMSRMVKTLLQYNKLNSDAEITKNKEKLAPIIAERTAKFKPLIEAKNITFTETVNENAVLECNKELLGIAIDNLLSNAVKFTAENGEIRITAIASGRNISFEIFNSGSSVSSEDAPHIWEELYSGDKARTRSDSSGMGLAICKRIFTLHGFTYGCRNETDGVTFYFSAHR